MRFKYLFITLALFGVALAAAAEIMPAEKLLPGDTLFMVTTPDFAKVRSAYQNSPHGQLWNDPSMKDFKDKFMDKLNSDYLIPLEHDLGIHFSDFTNLAQGQMTFAMMQNAKPDSADQVPAMLFLMDTKGQSARLKTNLVDLKKKWVDSGKTIKTEKIRSVDFSVAIFSADDMPKTVKKSKVTDPNAPEPFDAPDPKNVPKKQIYVGQVDSLLIVGSSASAIEKVLARMAGGEVASLSDTSSFSGDSGMFRDALIFGWANTKAYLDIFNRSADADSENANPLMPAPKKIIAALGLNGLNTIAFNYLYSGDGLQVNLKIDAPENTRTGLLKIMAGESKECTPPPFVPADVTKFQRVRIDGGKTWDTLQKMVGELSPSGLVLLNSLVDKTESTAREKDPDFNFKNNLLGNIGDDLIIYQKSPKGGSVAEMSAPPGIYLIGSTHADKLAASLKSIMGGPSSGEGGSKDRDFLGHKIYTVDLSPAPGSEAGSLSFSAGKGYVAMTKNTAMLEEFLRNAENPGKALRDLPGLSDASQKVSGTGTTMFGYSNESEAMRAMLELVKKDPGAHDPMAGLAPLAMAMGVNNVKIKDWLDVSLLPKYDQISKFFYFSVYALSANPDGLTFKGFSPTPPGLKK